NDRLRPADPPPAGSVATGGGGPFGQGDRPAAAHLPADRGVSQGPPDAGARRREHGRTDSVRHPARPDAGLTQRTGCAKRKPGLVILRVAFTPPALPSP